MPSRDFCNVICDWMPICWQTNKKGITAKSLWWTVVICSYRLSPICTSREQRIAAQSVWWRVTLNMYWRPTWPHTPWSGQREQKQPKSLVFRFSLIFWRPYLIVVHSSGRLIRHVYILSKIRAYVENILWRQWQISNVFKIAHNDRYDHAQKADINLYWYLRKGSLKSRKCLFLRISRVILLLKNNWFETKSSIEILHILIMWEMSVLTTEIR